MTEQQITKTIKALEYLMPIAEEASLGVYEPDEITEARHLLTELRGKVPEIEEVMEGLCTGKH